MSDGEEPVVEPTLESLQQANVKHAATEHLGSAISEDMMKDYKRRVFEATFASSAKATATAQAAAALAGRGVDVNVAAVTGVAAKVSTSDGVGRLSSELLAHCEVTFPLPSHGEP
eukprot:jgi/Tetstr1/444303/TSEL_032194.t1